METEKQLLSDILHGGRDAGRRLYGLYCGDLMAVCMRYMAQRDDARDVLQDAFVKILTHIGTFEYRGEGSLRSWMRRIAANESIVHLRRRQLLFTASPPPEDLPDDDAPPERVPPEELMRMIGTLPTGYRTVLNMFVFERMTHGDIARRLGIKESTSASQYLRAKQMLARKIKEYIKQQES